MAAMDPNMFPWMSAPMEPGPGIIPQQPPQAPVASTPGPGFWGSMGSITANPMMQSMSLPFAGAGGPTQFPPPTTVPIPGSQESVLGPQPPQAPPSGGGQLPPGATPTAGAGGNKLLDALRGVKAPPAPTAQTVRTPPPPQISAIKGDNLIPMLTSLGIGPQQFMAMMSGRR